jgi:hypothetical protein
VTTLAAIGVVVLALGAAFLPGDCALFGRQGGLVLVLDPLGTERGKQVFEPLVEWLAAETDLRLDLALVATPSDLVAFSRDRLAVVLCPDAVALTVPREEFEAVASISRRVPHNLRPRSVLVYRRTAGLRERPWLTEPQRTVLGDTLTLSTLSGILAGGESEGFVQRWSQLGCAVGPDPFDHAPVLHAARLGCYDYAVVRQWTAERFLASGLLPVDEWAALDVSEPVPDFVVLASRALSVTARGRLREALLRLGAPAETPEPKRAAACAALSRLDIAGFSLLLDQDLERYRRRFAARWPTPRG